MNISEMTIGQFQELQNLFKKEETSKGPWVIGTHYVIRTVTMIQTGTLKAVYPNELVLSNAVWVADTGRFHDFLKDPNKLSEAEPFTKDVIVGRNSIIDSQEIPLFEIVQK